MTTRSTSMSAKITTSLGLSLLLISTLSFDSYAKSAKAPKSSSDAVKPSNFTGSSGIATMAESETGSNFFTVPSEQSEIPAFNEVRSREGKLRKILLGAEKDNIPDFRQVRMLPTLTGAQRKMLQEGFAGNKSKVQEITAKLRQLKDKNDGTGGMLIRDPKARAEFEQLRTQLQELRRKSWEDMKTQLSAQQLRDLEAMRKGELQPATLREQPFNPSATMAEHMMQESAK